MPQWFLPYTAAALIAAALGWVALNYDPDAGEQTAKPVLAGAPAPGQPGNRPAQSAAPAGNAAPAPPAAAPAAAASTGAEAAVRRLIETAMTTDNPSDCTVLYTQGFLEQLAGEVGAEAVDQCRDNSDGDADSESVRFRSVSAAADGYRVAVTLEGGELGGTSFTLAVAHKGNWKIDRLIDADVDMAKVAAAAADEARKSGANDADAQCLESRVAAGDERAYERAILEGRSEEYAEQIFSSTVGCLSAETLRKQIAEGIRAGAGDAPPALIECVIDRILEGRSAADLRAMLQMEDGAGAELGRQAAAECAQMPGAAS